jgi:hypothetical protein
MPVHCRGVRRADPSVRQARLTRYWASAGVLTVVTSNIQVTSVQRSAPTASIRITAGPAKPRIVAWSPTTCARDGRRRAYGLLEDPCRTATTAKRNQPASGEFGLALAVAGVGS